MDHSRAPVLEALTRYRARKETSFTPLGHKQGRGTDRSVVEELGFGVFEHDVLVSGGLDDRLGRDRVLERAEALMADAVHAEHTFFSTCGSSLSVKAAMLAVAGPHETLLVGRDVHKSVVAGLIISGVHPVWLEPQWDRERHIAHPPSPRTVEEALAAHPSARGVLVASPTPYGSTADLAAIARACHEVSRPLIVDEAWGAHLPFHGKLPTWAMDAGADVCVTSIHKAGGGLEQGSVFHLQGDLVDPANLKLCAGLLGTTSPSALVLAGVDTWRRQMVRDGRQLLSAALDRAHRVHAALEGIEGLEVYGRAELVGAERGKDFDPLPTVVDVSGLGTSGFRVADEMRERHGVDLHLADHRRVNAHLTYADDDGTVQQLLAAFRDIAVQARQDARLHPAPAVAVPTPEQLRLPQTCLPRDAFFGQVEDIPLHTAEGRVVAEMLTPYPPGIPAALPGEQLGCAVLEYLSTGIAAGMNLPDAVDPTLTTVRVLAEGAYGGSAHRGTAAS